MTCADSSPQSWHLQHKFRRLILCTLDRDRARRRQAARSKLRATRHVATQRFPACLRAQVKYKEVMKQYNLGPNGGILTSLNMFATRFDQVRFCVPTATKGLLVRDSKRFSSHAELASLAVVRGAGAWRM